MVPDERIMSTAQTEYPSGVDAFTTEVIRSALVAITTEMKTNLMRTAYHTIIYEAEDFTVGLFDADGNTISIGLGLPMFIRGLSDCIKAKLAFWGKVNIEPGDILLTNDSYIMGSHLNHMIFTLPIFNDGELVAFSSSMAHWQDIARHRRPARRRDPRYFFRRAADAFCKKLPRRQGKPGDHVDH
jgi:N-methylhydantoinase B